MQQQTQLQTQQGKRGVSGRIHYVDGEVCAVLAVENDVLAIRDGVATGDTAQLLAALYRRVKDTLNSGIARVLKTWRLPGSGRHDPLEQALTPEGLLRARDRKMTQLRQLRRNGIRKDETFQPYVLLPRAEAHSTVLAFYSIDGPEIGSGTRRPVNDWRVRELVNLVNRRLLEGTEAQRVAGGWNVLAATPNWITAGGGDDTCPGPGSRPQPAEKGQWGFEFPGPAKVDGQSLADVVNSTSAADYPSDVVVCVLDTSPSLAFVQQRDAAINPPGAAPINALLHVVAGSSRAVKIDGALSADEQYFQFLEEVSPNWHSGLPSTRPRDHFKMPDHGLFSAGIIRDVAPAADVHLIRVMNEYGVGDVLVLAKILSDLPKALLKTERQRLVINMSLMCDVPVSERLVEFWFPNCYQDPKTLCDRWADICATFYSIQTSIEAAVSWTQEQADRVLVVAAAGNDNLEAVADGYGRPEPRYPARYDDVFGVAAVKSAGTASDFSNRGDIVIMGNGVAVYGGDATPSGNDEPPDIPPLPGGAAGGKFLPTRDGVVGIYTAGNFPLSAPKGKKAPPNTSGWAYWSGTSFATPVISAIAADYWAKHRDAKPWQIRTVIRALQTDLDGQLDVPAISAEQFRT